MYPEIVLPQFKDIGQAFSLIISAFTQFFIFWIFIDLFLVSGGFGWCLQGYFLHHPLGKYFL